MTGIPLPADGIAWVTGASQGIGYELALQLVAAGWTVAVSARGQEGLERLAALHPGRIIAAPVDVTDTAAVMACVAMIEQQAGRPIVRAVLNAGIYVKDTAPTFTVEAFKKQVDVNLVGTANGLAAVMPAMIAAKRGQIGVVSSLTGLAGLPAAASYGATKAALLSLCQSLKFDLDKAGVGISVILPGFVKTPATDKNDFPMPYLMEVEDAARTMLRGLDEGRFFIAFPGGLAWPIRILRMLPAQVYFKVVAKFTNW